MNSSTPKMRDSKPKKPIFKAKRLALLPGGRSHGLQPRRPAGTLQLNLTIQEKADLVYFLEALQGDPVADDRRRPYDAAKIRSS